jgi:iron complex transport system permease protein
LTPPSFCDYNILLKSQTLFRWLASIDFVHSDTKRPITPGKVLLITACGVGITILAAVASLSVGPVAVPFAQVVKVLTGKLFHLGPGGDPAAETIVLSLRGSRVLLAILVGAGLSVAGCVLQALIRNPLGDPYIMGTTSGSMLGVIAAALWGIHGRVAGAPLPAFLGAVAATAIVYRVARTGGKINTTRLILAGVIVSAFFSASAMLLLSISPASTIRAVTFWMMGDLGTLPARSVLPIAPYVVSSIVLLYLAAGPLNLIMVSEESALHLGVNVERVKTYSFLLTAFLTGAVVSVSGSIGFVGLVVPNVVRHITGPDLRKSLPLCVFAGSTLLLLADLLSRVLLAPRDIPVGAVTAFIGAPFFIYLLQQRVE